METKVEKNIIDTAKKVLADESEAIKSLISTIGSEFEEVVNLILNSRGKVVLSGIGKSAIIAQKISATLNSTGQKAVFMHATDAVHGDLGIIDDEDVIVILSKSGNTPELKVLIPLIRRLPNKLVGMVSDLDSFLARNSDYVLNAHVNREACPMNLAPTTSTTVSLALGDALAVCLLEARGFTKRDFAKYHPGGSLGKKLYLKVSDIYPNNEVPIVKEEAGMEEVILEMTSKRLGTTAVINEEGHLTGIITDGDLRRKLREKVDVFSLKALDLMSRNPKVIRKDDFAVNALNLMQELSITQLVVAENQKVLGFVHLHDLLREGLV
ncbi:KpsF/GutQ family protein [Leadbetterella byssophila DSM 17132]|uniref:KpsF/GutQ family protein n=1 Tax=Leadbetterella byssophila (strain DSM 17132 / JCM 16389 / KACC 11308 / NBRC 106382 / 4M15) TaxID=649349 RepID=E4RWS7_LEAB4|nr:KpsF/GutQ family sugar-phosphate isomerase [Leadbetterella byssophila]ADQ16246.1 KpsF/GutQ family protein [Leadbetterella byssophila DSM 17132]